MSFGNVPYRLILIAAPGICACWGDPHCYQFDGYDSMTPLVSVCGSCLYTLVQDSCTTLGDPSFEIIGNFFQAKPFSERTFVKEVIINWHGGPPAVS